MEIIPAPGESRDVVPRARGLDGVANSFFSRCHFAFAQAVFLERVIGGIHLNRPQGDNLPVNHEANVIPTHSLLEPVGRVAPGLLP